MAFPEFDMEELSSTGLLWLFLTFGFTLFQGSSLIAEGSDLLLLVPAYAGIVGSCVLPVLGAVPDGAIMLFSGMGEISQAQEQLAVGVGALAGSTIMLLTIPWALATIAGRVDIDNGECNYKGKPKLSSEKALTLYQCGVAPYSQVRTGAIAMMLTSISYLIIQGPCIKLEMSDLTGKELAAGEKWFALLGLCTALFGFFAYLTYQVITSGTDKDTRKFKADELIKKKLRQGNISIAGAMSEIVAKELMIRSTQAEYQAVASPKAHDKNSEAYARLAQIVRPFFKMFDNDNNGSIDQFEAGRLLEHLGEKVSQNRIKSLFQEMDSNKDGHIDFDEFVTGLAKYLQNAIDTIEEEESSSVSGENKNNNDDTSEEIEEEEIPSELAGLSPAQQQSIIKRRALFKLMLGTIIVLIFSDPMVDVMSEIGRRIQISPFYVSFVLAPLASNASELISAFNFALKKTPKTITISYASLEGAACMNNTFALSIFFMLIFFRGLAWAYTAETISILIVQILMALIAFKRKQTLADAALVLSFYPLSIALVALLESAGLD
mmetsp:Transcript_3683/g.5169  ORF Transcript_3683/g.5169 Transcript_3683/m.5169 type:complete len:550 (-) Transcript_3683:375-2024(-)|eukprot:CAMPEP_0197320380 /NCGR_PEP_ID=MMETSP0891-20130614/59507_1 /TAXON_ID=44058 ORGANISM="Aureoumbra lagunensis, Strain CCMP1510" /NCGR_SAMPLE_ID=MMETSP0891 /ASSEMBLY_ACC=CAM_ASM_000534 /LENGTH=549 /DNA_ID=CAMNT_0042811745 /DNA_START=104 /DNA_END=1753 /DNA_ORIENTATION=+